MTLLVKNEGCCSRIISAISSDQGNYTWSTGSTADSIVVYKNGTYAVTTIEGGISITKSVTISDIMNGDFPKLSFNSVFHPDNQDPFWESKCHCTNKFLGICYKWEGCWLPGKFKNKFYVMDVSPGKVYKGIPNSYNANEYKLEIWHRWNTNGGQGNPLKVITGSTIDCNGFNNWDIFWDGTDQDGNSLRNEKADAYTWRLTLKNCTQESSSMTFQTTWNPTCGDCVKWKKFLWWTKCAEYEGCWNTETFEFGDVEMTR